MIRLVGDSDAGGSKRTNKGGGIYAWMVAISICGGQA